MAAERELLRIATAGSVDDGKSTLIGRLLLDAKGLYDDHAEALAPEDLANVTDGLRAEREQGITIDVAYRYFATPRRSFIIADTPGHLRYTRNMVTGASTAALSLLLIDARTGVVEQTRRHAYLSSLLGIRNLVACVNKMDLVGWDEDRYRELEADFLAVVAELDVPAARAIPVSALAGDNVVDAGTHSPWYDGPSLLTHLEEVDVTAGRNLDDLRLPVQWVVRPSGGPHADYRGFAGQLAGGVLHPGDEVVVLPAGSRTRVARIDTYDGPVDEAFPPMSVTVVLEDDLDVGRGALIAGVDRPPVAARELEATVCWMVERPLQAGQRYLLKHTTNTVRATVEKIHARIDIDRYEGQDTDTLELNDIGRVTLRTSGPVMADPYTSNRPTGAFILVDETTHDTAGGGMIRATAEGETVATKRSPGVTWHRGTLAREDRWDALEHGGATIWFTGLPASGKSTIAAALERELLARDRHAYLIDGDNVRHGLSGDLGFDAGDRSENVRRVAHVARLFADAGTLALVSLVSPARADRENARRLHDAADLAFLEVFVDTPVEECARRDPKGLYAQARQGRLSGLTGRDAPYEAPAEPDVVIRTQDESVDAAVHRLLALLADRDL